MAGSGGKAFWIVPAATFLVGLVLGGPLIGIGRTGGFGDEEPGQEAAAPAGSPSPTSSPSPSDATVTVPAACVEAAEFSDEVIALAQDTADALGQLDARRLTQLVGQLEDLDPRIREAAQQCRAAATGNASPSPTS